MLFKLTNRKADRTTHAGVLEFVAEEAKVFLPYWVIVFEFFHNSLFVINLEVYQTLDGLWLEDQFTRSTE